MSPLWRDRLHIALCPQRVILVRFGRGLRHKVQDKATIPCDEAATGAPPWQAALAALRQALEEPRWQRAEARVILSNHFVRYLALDWDESLSSHDEQLALARLRFSQIYGEAANAWDYRWDAARPPAPCIASAIDHALLAALGELLADADIHLSLTATQPYLMVAFNRWRRELDPQRDWFLLAEPGRLCLAWFQADEWRGLHSQPVTPEWEHELPRILDRVLLLAGMTRPPERLAIHAPETPETSLAPSEGWSTRLLRLPPGPGFTPAVDAAYAMAMNP